MAEDSERRPGPHTVKAGILDALMGNRGPKGELMSRGQPALVEDLPEDEQDADED